MSNCIKDLYDYDLATNCSECGIVSLKSNFNEELSSKDGIKRHCKNCVNQKQQQYDNKNRERKKG